MNDADQMWTGSAFLWEAAKSFWPILFAFVAFVIATLYRQSLEGRLRRPKLEIEFGGDARLMGESEATPIGNRYIYVRGLVKNSGRNVAKNCQIFITEIWREDENGISRRVDYSDPLQLRWSAVPESDRVLPRDIFNGLNIPFDILKNSNNMGEILELCCAHYPTRYKKIFETPGKYQIFIKVFSDNSKISEAILYFNWGLSYGSIKLLEK